MIYSDSNDDSCDDKTIIVVVLGNSKSSKQTEDDDDVDVDEHEERERRTMIFENYYNMRISLILRWQCRQSKKE